MQMGFFSKEQLGPVVLKQGPKKQRVKGCAHCGLDKQCETPMMAPVGEGRKGILIVGECPTEEDDLKGAPFSGKEGQLLRVTLKQFGVNMNRDCIRTYAVACRNSNNKGDDRTPTAKEIDCCRNNLLKTIEETKPKLILLLGGVAVDAFLAHRKDEDPGTIFRWRGWTIPDREVNAWVCPMFDLSLVNKSKHFNPAAEVIFNQDMERALNLIYEDLPDFGDEEAKIHILRSPTEVEKFLKTVQDKTDLISFDYEATGLKPHAKGHRIVSCSISTGPNNANPFLLYKENIPQLKEVLKNKDLGKSAFNIKFEEMWSRVILNTPVQNWQWDSMLTSHILDNRENICSLKFQTYINFGLLDYNSHIEPFLHSIDSKNANSFNRIDEIPTKDLLIYNGYDSMFEYRLGLAQKMKIKRFQKQRKFFHLGAKALMDAEHNGIRIDTEYCHKQDKHLKRKMAYLEQRILEYPEVQYWKRTYGRKFKLKSDTQLAHVLFDHMQLESKKKTSGGGKSVDKEALAYFADSVPFVKDLLQIRKLKKLRDYLKAILRETVDGYLHPSFNLHTVDTYRSSSSNINFQNIPKRDKEGQKIVRRAIIPRDGHFILEIDYSGVEVKIACCYHKDPTMKRYIEDKTTDMHRDMSEECFLLPREEVSKDIRDITKNKYVFPEFYGDYFEAVAKNMWDSIDLYDLKTESKVPLKEHLKKKGIKNLKQFTDHIQNVEEDFWNKRFKVYQEWKDEQLERYQKDGYVDLYTGFRCGGYMRKNQVINYPVQGAAFHCLLWSFIKISMIARKEKWRSKIIGQIHDSIVIDCHPSEFRYICKLARKIMCQDIREEWDWIIVPLEVGIDRSPVNKSWYEKKEIKDCYNCKHRPKFVKDMATCPHAEINIQKDDNDLFFKVEHLDGLMNPCEDIINCKKWEAEE
jgi:uracil-DNA glycosylase family 4